MKKNIFVELLCLFCQKVYFAVSSLLQALGCKSCYFSPSQYGTLIVTGQDSIEIELVKKPKYVKVYFKDTCVVVPCNPQGSDLLQYAVDCNLLTVSWDVSSVREIAWEVF